MGSSTSKPKKNAVIKAKLEATSAFLATTNDKDEVEKPGNNEKEDSLTLNNERRQTRKDIFDFIEQSKRDKTVKDLEKSAEHSGNDISSEEILLYKVPEEVDYDNLCALCGKSTLFRIDGFPCRVCSVIYHPKCVQKSAEYSKEEKALANRAATPFGWSCKKCDNIFLLINDEEQEIISKDFRTLDVNKDNTISFEEYAEFHMRQYQKDFGEAMDDFDKELLRLKFSILDADKNGSVDLAEFKKNLAAMQLSHRSKEDLVRLLSVSEIRSAKHMFDLMDMNKDGSISEWEARNAYRSFYSSLTALQETEEPTTGSDIQSKVTSHFDIRGEQIMEADENNDMSVDWPEFLKGQALSIITSRPNKYGISTK